MSDIGERSPDPPHTIKLLAVWPEDMVEMLETSASEKIGSLRLMVSEAEPDTFRYKLRVGRHHILVASETAFGAGPIAELAAEQLSLAMITPQSAEMDAGEAWSLLAPAVLVLPADIEPDTLVAFVQEVCRLLSQGYRLYTVIANAWERMLPSSIRPRLYVSDAGEAVWPVPLQPPDVVARPPAAVAPAPALSAMPFILIQTANIATGDQVNINRKTRLA